MRFFSPKRTFKFLSIAFVFSTLTITTASAQSYTWYQDLDGDGWGNPNVSQVAATQPTGYVLNKLDCDDGSVNGDRWEYIDSTASATHKMYVPGEFDIKIDGNNNPYIGVITAPYQLTVFKYDGTKFIKLPSFTTNTHNKYTASLALGINDTPYILYPDLNLSGRLTLKKYNGTSWVVVGYPGFSPSSTNGAKGSLQFSANGTPYVAYSDDGALTVMKFDGTYWVYEGGRKSLPLSSSFGVDEFVIGSTGTLFISTMSKGVGFDRYFQLYKLSGGSWVTASTKQFVGLDNTSSYRVFDFDFDNNDTPYLIFGDTAHNTRTTVKKYNGTSWVTVGSAGFSDSTTVDYRIVIDNVGTPYVLYGDQTFPTNWGTVKKFNGSNWVTVGSAYATTNAVYDLTLDMAPNGVLYYTHRDYSHAGRAFRRLAPKGATGSTGPTMPTTTATPDTINAGDSSTLKVTAGMLNDATDWIWYTGNCGGTKTTPSSTNVNGSIVAFKPTATTTYYVRGEGGCLPAGACDSVTVTVNTTSINSIANSQANLSLYPNPNTGVFTVKGMFSNTASIATITVMNNIGQKVYGTTTNTNNGKLIYELTMPANTPQGMYLLSIEVDGHVYHKRMNLLED